MNMSNELAKYLNSRRRFSDETAVKKQLRIAQKRGSFPKNHTLIKQPHRLSKHHALDCGNPQCGLCGNPRHIWKDSRTIQEKSFDQTKNWTSNE